MHYILLLKNNIAIAKGRYKTLKKVDLGACDSLEEITENEFKTVELPAKKIGVKWVKTDEMPDIEYPAGGHKTEEPTIDELFNIILGVEL